MQIGAFLRKKMTPLQTVSLTKRGHSQTTLQEELSEGLAAFGYLRAKNDSELMRMISAFAILIAKSKTSTNPKETKEFIKELETVRTKLFKYAHSIGMFTDTRVATSALIQSIDYLSKNPKGEYASIASQVVEQLNVSTSLGAPNQQTNTFFNPWLVIVILLSIHLFTGRSV